MKALFATLLFCAVTIAWAVDAPSSVAPAATVKGEVLEVKEVEAYTYLRLKTKDGETWAAVEKTPVKKGAQVTVENVIVMNNFESKSLNKTFPAILFGNLAGATSASGTGGAALAGKTAGAPAADGNLAAAHAGLAKNTDIADVKVPKASGANARTVAEIVTKGAELKDKPVLVRGKIVKYNAEIMGKNWVHLRDGSGAAADGSNDILVTTTSQAKAGDIVTVKGVVRTDKDFGAGYNYKVLIEDATLQP